jgi:hypothetical protein
MTGVAIAIVVVSLVVAVVDGVIVASVISIAVSELSVVAAVVLLSLAAAVVLSAAVGTTGNRDLACSIALRIAGTIKSCDHRQEKRVYNAHAPCNHQRMFLYFLQYCAAHKTVGRNYHEPLSSELLYMHAVQYPQNNQLKCLAITSYMLHERLEIGMHTCCSRLFI